MAAGGPFAASPASAGAFVRAAGTYPISGRLALWELHAHLLEGHPDVADRSMPACSACCSSQARSAGVTRVTI